MILIGIHNFEVMGPLALVLTKAYAATLPNHMTCTLCNLNPIILESKATGIIETEEDNILQGTSELLVTLISFVLRHSTSHMHHRKRIT